MTNNSDGIAIDDFEELPGTIEPLQVLVPLLQGTSAGEFGQVAIDAADLQEAVNEGYDLPSSLVREADQWQVTEIDDSSEEFADVFIGRRGIRVMGIRMASGALEGVNAGDSIIATDLLWRGGGVLGFGKVDVQFVPDPDPPAPIPIMVPVMRLHRPRQDGCEASYAFETADGDSANMTVKVLGVGAGGGFKVGLNITRKYTARTSCVETVIPAKMQLLPGRTMVDGTEVAYGIRAKVIDFELENKQTRAVPAEYDYCERSGRYLDGLVTAHHDLREAPAGDTSTITIDVDTQTSGKISIGLETGGPVPINLGVDYERTTQQTMTIETTLAAGTRYTAYSPSRNAAGPLEQQLEICWTRHR